ncbi:hypothetical protein [Paraburkholderia fungorum]|uniref:hypothetical protein n=1 Tax=Paraburkholderia fungorum TaxID=134537 RepID=UPI003877BBCB
MIREVTEAEFIQRFADLIDRFNASIAADARPEFAGAEAGDPHEHTTRVHFLDELVELLGWSLGLGGDMAEEARLKGETTTFMDYLGVRADTNAPALLIEAKAWDKAFLEPRKKNSFDPPVLLGAGINHWRSGGEEKDSPVAGQWHAYIKQVGGYVKGLKERYGHTLPRAVITSGQWIVVFVDPVQAFVEGTVEDVKIKIFQKQNFKAQAGELFSLLSRKALAAETPFDVRPTQVLNYLTRDLVVACFHAVHVSYEASGSPVFGRKPRVLVYPALVLRGADNMLLTVLEESEESLLEYTKDETADELSLGPHVDKLAAAAAAYWRARESSSTLSFGPRRLSIFLGSRTSRCINWRSHGRWRVQIPRSAITGSSSLAKRRTLSKLIRMWTAGSIIGASAMSFAWRQAYLRSLDLWCRCRGPSSSTKHLITAPTVMSWTAESPVARYT